MSQQEQIVKKTNPCVLVRYFKEDSNQPDIETITPQLQELVDAMSIVSVQSKII